MNCWRYTGILPQAAPPEVEDLLTFCRFLNLRPCSPKAIFRAQTYADTDSNEDIAEALSDNDLLELDAPAPAEDEDTTADSQEEVNLFPSTEGMPHKHSECTCGSWNGRKTLLATQ